MKIIFLIVGVLISLFTLLQVFVWWQDQYSVLDKSVSPDGKLVGLLVGNYGGGGPGYCRDLIYNFPNSEELPSITSNWAESRNKEYLVKVVSCGAIKKLEWENNELVWQGKGTIPNY